MAAHPKKVNRGAWSKPGRPAKLPPKPHVSPDLPRKVQTHGGSLLAGGVPGNRGSQIGHRRRQIRKALLKIIEKRGGLKLLGDIVEGLPVQPIRDSEGQAVHDADGQPLLREAGLELRQRTVIACLQYGLGQLNQHNLVDEADQSLEPSVVELPALNPPPVPPEELEAVEVARPLVPVSPARSLEAAAALRAVLKVSGTLARAPSGDKRLGQPAS
jgi:hypothetical protein